ncbi:MAG: DUF5683 domain-containing protein [Cyclobacteriaceae bacterium]|nr:DUF5683 domain-containing protein [Cyclobacteriaceae bacterium]
MRFYLLFGFLFIASAVCYAQKAPMSENDSIVKTEQTKRHEKPERVYDPRIAGLYSAVLPGLGQAYNKKYWKIPFIYGAFTGFYIVINRYETDYQTHRKGLLYAISNDSYTNATSTFDIDGRAFTEEHLRNSVNKLRRERDYWIIIGSIFYLLNIVDAHIDAHLREFDVNEKLKLTVDPSLSQSFNSFQTGLSITLHFH